MSDAINQLTSFPLIAYAQQGKYPFRKESVKLYTLQPIQLSITKKATVLLYTCDMAISFFCTEPYMHNENRVISALCKSVATEIKKHLQQRELRLPELG